MRKSLLLGSAVVALALSSPVLAQTRQNVGGEQGAPGSVQTQTNQDASQSAAGAKQQSEENSIGREGRTTNRLSEPQNRRNEQNYGQREDRRDYGERNEGRRERGTVGRATEDRYYRDDRDDRRERYGDRDRYEDRARYGERYDRRYDDRRYGRVDRSYGERRDVYLSRRARSHVRDVLVHRRVQPANIDFPIRIGARIPAYIESYDLPQEVYEWAPGYEGYRYFETEDEIVIVDPQTMEVVAVLDQ